MRVIFCIPMYFLTLFYITGCSFDGLLAQCPMVLGGHHVDVSARINHCHSPVDVSFLVVANNDRNPSSQNTDMVS